MSAATFGASDVVAVVLEQSRRILDVYRADPGHVTEHANSERRITQGGYGERQIYELVQNGADEIQDHGEGRIHVLLTGTSLYCANTGSPMTPEGADTILRMSVSRKRGGQIGRFGVGVKSVLSVTDTPRFYSRAGSFGFDKEWSAHQIRSVVALKDGTETPVLRMAQPLELADACAQDPILAALLEWATTVVVLPLKRGTADRLGRDLRGFPTHFPLFSAHVTAVVLEDQRPQRRMSRSLTQRTTGATHIIREEANGKELRTERWQVFSRDHEPSLSAQETAGELHERPTIRISWAVPHKGVKARKERGQFWAYFPTNYDTTLTGVLNAAWKTNEDRQNLLQSEFNTELIRSAAELIVDSVPELLEPEDPGSYLTLLTARGREASQWADRMISQDVLTVAAHSPSLPDQGGVLRVPATLRLHPEGLRPEWLQLWAECKGRPDNWCHHSVESRERRSRVRDIMETAGRSASSIREWLEALVSDGSAEGSAIALRIAADMQRSASAFAAEAVTARILLTERGRFIAPTRGCAYRRTPVGGQRLQDNWDYVHEDVVRDPETVRALEELGIPEADAEGRFRAVLDRGFSHYGDGDWVEFWSLLRSTNGDRAVSAILNGVPDYKRTLKVRCADGAFRPMRDCLLAGRVVPADGSRDPSVLVNPEFHRTDLVVLRDLRMTDAPIADVNPRMDAWYAEYEESVREAYYKSLPADAPRTSPSRIIIDGSNPAGPLHLLTRLSPEGRAEFVRALPPHGMVHHWQLQIGKSRYAEQQAVRSPIAWLIKKEGWLPTSLGTRRTAECVSPTLEAHSDLLPVADVAQDTATALRLPARLTDIAPPLWSELITRIHESTDDTFPGRAYALLALATDEGVEIPWPADLDTRCRVGRGWATEPDADIYVTAEHGLHRSLVQHRLPALLVPTPEDAERMRRLWSMRDAATAVHEEIEHTPAGDSVPLTDLYPRLRLRLERGVDWHLVHCSVLAKVVSTDNGQVVQSLTEARVGSDVLVCGPDDELSVLLAVDRALGLRMGGDGCRALLAQQGKDRAGKRFSAVRDETDPARKLLLAVGVERLREHLPAGLQITDEELTGRPADDMRIAQLVMAVHGDDVLRVLAPAFREAGFEAPHQWVGGGTTRAFLKEYRFPLSWAGGQNASPAEPYETVGGPRDLPPLHAYQEAIVSNMYELLVRPAPGRAMLRLPTGAGKTRVAVEATVRAVRAGRLRGPVLWIAQSSELCEQAIETWRFVWARVGSTADLRISRMWQGYRPTPVEDGPHVVVGIDDTLVKHLGTEQYAWLRAASAVIVDEAHFAIPKTYTRILDHLGIDQYRVSRPMVGLTATAFRGTNEEETRRLVNRFGGARLDLGVFDEDEDNPYPHLQRLGVLSQVEQRELSGGTVALTAEQVNAVTNSNSMALPDGVAQRLADDVSRTKRIIDEIEKLPANWPVLVFSTSVEHSKVLAALLSDRGLTASSVDANTPTGIRARRIDDFRKGRTQVLTNYNVLTQGFDAPAVRAVVVARPTYSPNTYVQMIGRGLRGPLNGGKDSCLILNVRDNIQNFGRDLAYTQFEYLWKKAK
ncbi:MULTISPECIES: DEAD/DEAH box helicase [Streptomyces]|uniref:DEAD/DEAH box helicase n=2 Tax=Streptomyces TaxID=1883 RepID=A0A3M8F8T6_9ACTN|nr:MULTISPECIES: helicase-related protein [Streptomyces]KNE82134.1 hypothetical protein ADZ36_12385 [Streptomyces fradiae]OFA56524.1 hypothetical protein BEN35_06150 [Streptomyces fradiae]PQM22756.1 helicase [Streptomyces xinghaiensis]RKM97925.1 DEAD/DEAH box helicase [Streptomyces xinghaiensis]RNC73938.1 DEAD/DEAH box helicase [Streptomyces xinghaiensis]